MARQRRHLISWWIIGAVMLGFVLLLLLGLNAYDNLVERGDRRQEQINVLVADNQVLRDQLEELGEEPEAPPPEERVEEPDTQIIAIPGPKGDAGPSCVEEYGFQLCRGDPGADSTVPGPSCVEELGIEECQGPEGDQGQQGDAGASCVEEFGIEECQGPEGDAGEDSTVPGPSCVEELGIEACRGDPGDPGADGRGIVSIAIEGDIRACNLIVTYTDETTQSIPVDPKVCPHPIPDE